MCLRPCRSLCPSCTHSWLPQQLSLPRTPKFQQVSFSHCCAGSAVRWLLHLFPCPVCKHCLMLIQFTACFVVQLVATASQDSIYIHIATVCTLGCLALTSSFMSSFIGSTLATLFTVPLTKKRKRESDQQQQQQQQKRQAQNGTHKPFPPSHYRVTLQQMETNDYPLPVLDKQGNMTCPAAYVATQPAGDTFASVQSPIHINIAA